MAGEKSENGWNPIKYIYIIIYIQTLYKYDVSLVTKNLEIHMTSPARIGMFAQQLQADAPTTMDNNPLNVSRISPKKSGGSSKRAMAELSKP